MSGLSHQCEQLGVSFRRCELPRTASGWEAVGQSHGRPETAALALLRAEGWAGAVCEGGPILLLIKAACLPRLTEINTLGNSDNLTRFLEAQFAINADHLDSIYEAIGNATAAGVRANFEATYAAGVDQYYPGVSGSLIDQLYAALAPRLPMIAKRFAGDAPRSHYASHPGHALLATTAVA